MDIPNISRVAMEINSKKNGRLGNLHLDQRGRKRRVTSSLPANIVPSDVTVRNAALRCATAACPSYTLALAFGSGAGTRASSCCTQVARRIAAGFSLKVGRPTTIPVVCRKARAVRVETILFEIAGIPHVSICPTISTPLSPRC